LLIDVDLKARFQKEATIWALIDPHPYIVRAYQVLSHSGSLIIIMDWIIRDEHGRRTIHDAITQHCAVSDDQILDWALQFSEGMQHALKCGITVHRDIKPANLLVGPGNVLRISDFGSASAFASKMPRGSGHSSSTSLQDRQAFTIIDMADASICGTPGYIAPEIVEGGNPDYRCDIYSLGVVLWQLATVSLSFPYGNVRFQNVRQFISDCYRNQARGGYINTGRGFDHILHKCLAVRPSDRFVHYDELSHAISTYRKGKGDTHE
jgi:serine/threonine protein kinase